jgi:predicted transcriptional regulator
MPYIKKENRYKFEVIFNLIDDDIKAGELNYIITKIINKMLKNNMNYARCNEIIGALECCKLELYRRKIAPYEDKKMKENGDVE